MFCGVMYRRVLIFKSTGHYHEEVNCEISRKFFEKHLPNSELLTTPHIRASGCHIDPARNGANIVGWLKSKNVFFNKRVFKMNFQD
jgi:hypothetical protein